MVRIPKAYGATIGSFTGDRLMVISDDTKSPCWIAVQIALDMQRSINQILNKEILNHSGKRLITCGVGIDYGKMLAIKVGIKGENNQDLVWVGNTANAASKLTDQADGHEIRISKTVYDRLKKVKGFKSHRWTASLVKPLVLCYKTSITSFDKPDLSTLLLKYKQQSP
jgi:class 3 adenylate cyclase